MSASSKKKLRAEENQAKLTEKQLAEQKEAKKLKIYTIVFAVVLAAMIALFVGILVVQSVNNSGIREKNTIALTVGDNKLTAAELNYFYIDGINNYLQQMGSYVQFFGLNTGLPLDQQVRNEETGETWADQFLASAEDTAKSVYALCDEAAKVGFALSQDDLDAIEAYGDSIDTYAKTRGYSSADDYLRASYGNGSSKESYMSYYTNNRLANLYYTEYAQSLSYTDDEITAKDNEDPAAFSSYSYNQYYLSTSRFLTGGTTDEDGNTTYSDEEKAAAEAAAKAAAESFLDTDIATTEDFNAAVAALDINADAETTPTGTAYDDQLSSGVSSSLANWVKDSSRKAGDKTCIPNTSTTTAEDGTEVTTVNGYYVVLFRGVNANNMNLVNVRHILIGFEGGTTDDNGNTTYSADEKAAAKKEADELLAQWLANDPTEDSFAALVADNSDDTGSVDNGGLYENVYPGQMVTNFNDWCFDESRKVGDSGIVETNYGYHIIYFSGICDTTYREYMITETLRSNDVTEWYNALVDGATLTENNTDYVRKNLVLSNGN